MTTGVVVRKSPAVTICKESQTVTVSKKSSSLFFTAFAPIQFTPVNKPFMVVSTQGQTSFPLNSAPRSNGMLVVAINGVFQNHLDYTIVGNSIQFATGLDSGDIVAGIYEQA